MTDSEFINVHEDNQFYDMMAEAMANDQLNVLHSWCWYSSERPIIGKRLDHTIGATLLIQFQGRVETYSIQLSTRLVYLVQVLKTYYYAEKFTLQAWHYSIAWRSKQWRSRFYVQN